MKFTEIVVTASFDNDGFRAGYEMTCKNCTPSEAVAELDAWLAEQQKARYWANTVPASYSLVIKA